MATNSVHIEATRQRVFAVLSDGWAYSNWVVGASHMRAVEAGWPAPGSRLFHAAGAWPIMARDETVVESWEPNSKLVLTAKGRPLGEAKVVLELEDAGDGCRVTMFETPTAGPGQWLHNPVFEALLVRRNAESLARLAAIAEGRTSPSE
ncbi:MAG: SRPBCC family protein [Pseudonocardiales bacterium]|nr:SRPBCC family protein [Actinomycetota bacterium]